MLLMIVRVCLYDCNNLLILYQMGSILFKMEYHNIRSLRKIYFGVEDVGLTWNELLMFMLIMRVTEKSSDL